MILTKKEMDFVWGPEQRASMEDLKQAIVTAPCLQPKDYHFDRCVILAVDSSCIATGFILLQLRVTTSTVQAGSVLLLGVRENPTTLRQNLKFMASGVEVFPIMHYSNLNIYSI